MNDSGSREAHQEESEKRREAKQELRPVALLVVFAGSVQHDSSHREAQLNHCNFNRSRRLLINSIVQHTVSITAELGAVYTG